MSRINKPRLVMVLIVKAVSTISMGKPGLNAFIGAFETASMALLPDLTVGQLTQLIEEPYKPNPLLDSKDSKA